MRFTCTQKGFLRAVSAGCLIALAVPAALAQPAPTLREAVEAAWSRAPGSLSKDARQAALRARRSAADFWTPGAPAVSLEQTNDRISRNDGVRKYGAGIDVPLWIPGERALLRDAIAADEVQLGVSVAADRLLVAGDVREMYWQVRFAEAERRVAERKVEESAALLRDVTRRVQAGDTARIDAVQAQAAEQSARGAQADGEGRVNRARRLFRGLTGLDAMPEGQESPQAMPASVDAHPALDALRSAAASAQSRLRVAAQITRDHPEIGIGVGREREDFADPFKNVVSFRLKIPFATEARNQPRVTAANVELIEAQARLRQQVFRIEAESEAARRDLAQSEQVRGFAEERYRLATESQSLIARAFSLGQFDLPTRLRADNERFDAELALERARLEQSRAVSRLNQAIGVLP